MIRKILTYKRYFKDFMATLDEKARRKVNQGVLLLASEQRLSTKFVKHIREGLYELRTLWNGNIYRVFFIFDEGNIIILFNGFQKKTDKTPEKEIKRALNIKADYYADKEQ